MRPAAKFQPPKCKRVLRAEYCRLSHVVTRAGVCVSSQLRRVRLWPTALVLSYSASWQMHTCLHISKPCLFFFFLIPYLCPLITYVSDCCDLKWLNETSRVFKGASLKGWIFFFFCSLEVTCSFMQYLGKIHCNCHWTWRSCCCSCFFFSFWVSVKSSPKHFDVTKRRPQNRFLGGR